jgi:methionyl-tRNA formyltransferase
MAEAAPKVYVVAGTKPWNRRVFEEVIRRLPGHWHYVGSPAELTPVLLDQVRPRYVFFLHWSNKVPPEVFERHECVCFHMADVPYGRGGSPLQNLILAGHAETKLTALRMAAELDAGPVYFKEPLSLEGNAEEVYLRATRLSAAMIGRFVAEEPRPVPQTGEPVVFRRRRPAESALPADLPSLDALYDFVRMLDAEGYPHAFLRHGPFRLEFRRAARYDGRVCADVTITREADEHR